MRVGLVGTGRMGGAMAGRIRGAGFPVVVHNRTRAKAEQVAHAHGVEVAESAAAAVAGVDVVVVSLGDDDAALATYRGADGIVAGLAPGAVVADTSTIAPATVRELGRDVADAGATLLDTPVSGSVSMVEAGTLTVMAGGDPEALERARPVIESFAARIVHLGERGTGAAMKLAVNGILHGLNVALSEGLVLAERAGIDRATAYDVVANSAAGAPFVAYKRDAFLAPDTTPVAFSLDLVAKDLALVAALAAELGVRADQLAANRELVGDALDRGLGDADMSVLASMLRDAG
jgi:3-hydroxyisobutyrate dehydrogenase-like beta-hydroxyacid dehydrogenase